MFCFSEPLNPLGSGLPSVFGQMFQQGMSAPAAAQPATQLDVNSLLSSLMSKGLISSSSSKNTPVGSPAAKEITDDAGKPILPSGALAVRIKDKAQAAPLKIDPVPDLTGFNAGREFTQFHRGVIQALYSGIQCASCGVRFTSQEHSEYTEHLDWHFKQNSKDKDGAKVAKYRYWYYAMHVSITLTYLLWQEKGGFLK